jgi:MerR family transcriptional regulator/heat shock protein HspR
MRKRVKGYRKPMAKEFWTITEVVELLEVEESFLLELEEEEVICPVCSEEPPKKLFRTSDLERLRLAKALVEDMGVNLAGVEVILRMRQNMVQMRRQFDAILEDLAQEIQETLRHGSP